MRDAPRSNASTERWRSKVSSFLRREIPYFYLLRVPILTGFGLAGVCYLALLTPARSHMGGAFDINTYWGIFLVSFLAFLFASTVGVTWRLIRCYGPRRFFGRDPCVADARVYVSAGRAGCSAGIRTSADFASIKPIGVRRKAGRKSHVRKRSV